MNEKIYVLVEVTYDYYRFQENLQLSNNKDNLVRYANDLSSYDLIDYSIDSEEMERLGNNETFHFWIQEFNCL